MLFYFTATGNSLYVAKRLDPRCISIAQAIHDDPQPYQDAQIGIVCPVHAQQIPKLVSTFLHDAHFDTPYFYMILAGAIVKTPQQSPSWPSPGHRPCLYQCRDDGRQLFACSG